MKILKFNKIYDGGQVTGVIFSLVAAATLYFSLTNVLQWYNTTTGSIDPSIWLLLIFSIICFLIMALLTAWLLKYTLEKFGLPKINSIVSQFKNLNTCQQFAFYWASFALLFLGSLLSLVAIF